MENKSMYDYQIYCTAEQTEKAFGLGAPIEILPNYTEYRVFPLLKCKDGNDRHYITPTVEQMCGWLRNEHKIHVRIDCEGSENYVVQLQFINSPKDIDVENNNYKGIIGHKGYPSMPEATLAAIDAALEYLSNNKK